MEFILDIPSRLVLKGEEYLVQKFGISEADFWELSNEDTHFELIDGVLTIHSPASTEHEEIFSVLHFIFKYHTDSTKRGKVFGSRLVLRLSEKWNVEPDLIIVLPENYSCITRSRVEGRADLVVEILSPSTREIDLTKKLPQYRSAGIKEIWFVDPLAQEITLYWAMEQKSWGPHDMAEWVESKVFPDLKFKPSWVWQRESYPSDEILKELQKNS